MLTAGSEIHNLVVAGFSAGTGSRVRSVGPLRLLYILVASGEEGALAFRLFIVAAGGLYRNRSLHLVIIVKIVFIVKGLSKLFDAI